MTRRSQWTLLMAGYVVAVLCSVACAPASPATPVRHLREGDFLMSPVDAGVITVAPEKPLPGQKRGPCDPWEFELKGACYLRMEKEMMGPPCATGFVAHEGRCFKPLGVAPKPVSGQ